MNRKSKTKLQKKQQNNRELLRLFPTSPLDVAASFRRTIPMVIAASIVIVKETVAMDANKTYYHFGSEHNVFGSGILKLQMHTEVNTIYSMQKK